jgi:hypothetical protein
MYLGGSLLEPSVANSNFQVVDHILACVSRSLTVYIEGKAKSRQSLSSCQHCLQTLLAQATMAAVEERERSRAAATFGHAWVLHAQKENKCKVCERHFESEEQRQAFCHRYTVAQCVLSQGALVTVLSVSVLSV